jgi:hypothetical protein
VGADRSLEGFAEGVSGGSFGESFSPWRSIVLQRSSHGWSLYAWSPVVSSCGGRCDPKSWVKLSRFNSILAF